MTEVETPEAIGLTFRYVFVIQSWKRHWLFFHSGHGHWCRLCWSLRSTRKQFQSQCNDIRNASVRSRASVKEVKQNNLKSLIHLTPCMSLNSLSLSLSLSKNHKLLLQMLMSASKIPCWLEILARNNNRENDLRTLHIYGRGV